MDRPRSPSLPLHRGAAVPRALMLLLLVAPALAAQTGPRTGPVIQLCGQTAASRGPGREELLPGVKLAPSAMTTLVARQNQGYALIPW